VSISAADDLDSYPERLLINGRGLDAHFETTEVLYIRFLSVDSTTGRPSEADFRAPDLSVNRGKYSEPQDVLWGKWDFLSDWGYGSMTVSQVPGSLCDGAGLTTDFRVEHDPIAGTAEQRENYSHSEIRAYKHGERSKKLPGTVKLKFRRRIAEAIAVLKQPSLRDGE